MGKQNRVLRCYHCGAILQCEHEDEKGYIIPESLHRATPIQIIYCDKCFETMKAFNNSEFLMMPLPLTLGSFGLSIYSPLMAH